MHIMIRIPFKDVDLSQRIHYSSIFRYFEQADTEFFRNMGFPYKELFERGIHLPRVHVECDFMGEIHYDDLLELKTTIERIGNSSFTYRFEFTKTNVLVATGKMTIVFIDKEKGNSIPIPSEIRAEMQKHIEA